MGLFKRAADLVYTFRFLKLLTTQFEDTPAFKLGIIDRDGKRDKTVRINTSELKDVYTPFHRLVFNIKKIINKAPGSGKFASYAAALYLIKEMTGMSEDAIMKSINEVVEFDELVEESTNWYMLDENHLSPGIYKLKCDKIVNKYSEQLASRNDNIRILEDYNAPIGKFNGMNIYSGLHLNTGLELYFTTGEITK